MKSPDHFDVAGKLNTIEAISKEYGDKSIKLESFRGHQYFDDEEINRDLESCRKKKADIEARRAKMSPRELEQLNTGVMAEYAFRHAIADYGWLAPKVNVIISSLYDDYFWGIDSIAQIVEGEDKYEHIGFAMDFGTSLEDIGTKLAHTFDSLDNGFCPSAKYFDSEPTGKLKKFKLPRMVVGAGPETLERLISYSDEILAGSAISDKAKHEIKGDGYRYVLFGIMLAQIEVFCARLQTVIDKARVEKRPDIGKRAETTLKIHEKARRTLKKLALDSGVTAELMQKHLRGDSYAGRMRGALQALSLTPIVFKQERI